MHTVPLRASRHSHTAAATRLLAELCPRPGTRLALHVASRQDSDFRVQAHNARARARKAYTSLTMQAPAATAGRHHACLLCR